MAMTKTMNENEEALKTAIQEGISGEAVESTLEDVVNAAEQKGQAPKQLQETVESIAEMKNDTENVVDESYASDFVKQNNEKIKSALEEGITPKEVATTLVNSTNNSDTKKGKKHLNFIVKLIPIEVFADLKMAISFELS